MNELQRLAALVPRPRLHLIRFHGVLAPHAALRPQIVPGEPDQATVPSNETGDSPASTRARLSWAQLLKRVFEIDMAHCPQCGGPLTLIAAIEDPAVIAKILTHLGLPTRVPPRATARLDEFLQTASSPRVQTASSHPGVRFSSRTHTPPLPISPSHTPQ